NGDGKINSEDVCIPIGGFINALRPVNLALPLIEAAQRGERAVPPPPPTPQPTSQATILFQDDFSTKTDSWTVGGDEIATRYFKDGAFWIEVFEKEYIAWSTYQEEEFEDVTFQVSAEFKEAQGDASVGAICRYVNKSNFHAFEISNDGYYSFWKYVDGEFVSIKDWTYIGKIDLTRPFQITISCIGNRFQLTIDNR
ncbi:MAG: hypothetical protein ACK8QZ_05275, partial [Anaerolineales bacterium]